MQRKIQYLELLLAVLFIVSPGFSGGTGAAENMKNQERIILDFSNPEDQNSWRVVNDGVMGGLSQSEVIFKNVGLLTFRGIVSLDNNGGFASIRKSVGSEDFAGLAGMVMQLRGDGREYQLRVRTDDRFDGISYRHRFKTLPEKTQSMKMYFADFEPVFRGRIIKDAPPLMAEKIQQIGILIADKKEGQFRIDISWIKGIQ